MKATICQHVKQMGRLAAEEAAKVIKAAIGLRGEANVIFATGTSQFEVITGLIADPTILWAKVTGFHLDEYIGLPDTHPASFRKYLRERLVSRVHMHRFHYIQGDAPDAKEECQRLNLLIKNTPIDLALVGIGENGHLAFNDPPADFNTFKPYITVELDEACRRQQLGEGWFETLDDVPTEAITMSIQQIMKSEQVVCSVPDERKAKAVRSTIEGAVTPDVPASILRNHPHCRLFLDKASASLLAPAKPAAQK
jgi:glucosamine-6-phosphate deaminase